MDPRLQQYLDQSGAYRGRPFDRRLTIPNGVAGTAETIREMAALASRGGRDLVVRLIGLEIIEDVPGRDHLSICRAIFNWLQDRGRTYNTGIKFVNDPYGVETVQDPWITLTITGCGDCNSAHSTTSAALLLALGVPCFFRTIKVDPERPELFTHVYTVARVRPYKDFKGGDVAMDTSVPFSTLGSEPKANFGFRDWMIPIPDEDDWRA
jgi:hypothetical protein